MGKSGTLKLTDFGFARQLAPEERLYSQFGTPEYVAPEVLNGCGHGMPVDLWALGVLIYELLVGHTPFKARSVDEMYERIAAGEYAFPSPPSRRSSPSSSSSSKSLQRDNSRGKRVSMGKEGSRSRGSSNGGGAGGGCADGGAPGLYKSTGYRDRAGKGKVRGAGGSGCGSGMDAAQDPSAQALVKSLLCQSPRRRPSIAEIKRHPFFSGVNFDALRAAVRAQADAEEEEAVVAAAINGGEVWMREQPVVCISEDVDDNYGGVFAAF